MTVAPTTQQPSPAVVASPHASNGRFSQNTLLIAGVVSTVASIALAIFEMIAWTTAASVVTSLAVCYAISYFLPAHTGAQAAVPAAANDPLSRTNAAPVVTAPRTPVRSGTPATSLSLIIQRATQTPQRLEASLQRRTITAHDDDTDNELLLDDTLTPRTGENTRLGTAHLDTSSRSPPDSPTQGRITPNMGSNSLTAPTTPPQIARSRATSVALTQSFPSPMHPTQPSENAQWRREIVALFETYVDLLRQIKTFLAPSAAPVQNSDARRPAAEVLKQALQAKGWEILRKLAEKRTLLPTQDYRRYKEELELDVRQVRDQLDVV